MIKPIGSDNRIVEAATRFKDSFAKVQEYDKQIQYWQDMLPKAANAKKRSEAVTNLSQWVGKWQKETVEQNTALDKLEAFQKEAGPQVREAIRQLLDRPSLEAADQLIRVLKSK